MATQLTDLEIKNLKPKAKRYTKAFGKSLTLIVEPDGAKYWRQRYRFGGKGQWLSVGDPYPATKLKAAELAGAVIRADVKAGIDPAQKRKLEKLALKETVAHNFGDASASWLAFHAKAWGARTTQQASDYLDKDLLPKLRHRPLDYITGAELGALVAEIEKRGAFDIAKKVRQWLKSIFSYARAKGWTKADPARDLNAVAEKGPPVQHYAHVSLKELPAYLKAMDGYEGSLLVRACARLGLWTANRPGVTRTLRWDELDLDEGIWTIDRGRPGMKRGYYHLTPLPTQAIALLRELHKLTGTFEHVFIGRNDPMQALSNGAVAGMIESIGFRHKQTASGYRHLVSTALNDKGYKSDWVERQLAHGDPDQVRGTYNKAMYLKPRRRMMQQWADYLDTLHRFNLETFTEKRLTRTRLERVVLPRHEAETRAD